MDMRLLAQIEPDELYCVTSLLVLASKLGLIPENLRGHRLGLRLRARWSRWTIIFPNQGDGLLTLEEIVFTAWQGARWVRVGHAFHCFEDLIAGLDPEKVYSTKDLRASVLDLDTGLVDQVIQELFDQSSLSKPKDGGTILSGRWWQTTGSHSLERVLLNCIQQHELRGTL